MRTSIKLAGALHSAHRAGLLHRLPGLFGPDGVGLVPSLPTSGRGHSSYLSDPVLLDAIAQVALHPPGSPLVASTRYGATP